MCRDAFSLECSVCSHTFRRSMVPAPIASVSQPSASGTRRVQTRMDFTRAGPASDDRIGSRLGVW